MQHVLQLALGILFCLIPMTLKAESNIPFITTDELKTIYDAKGDFLLINALSPIEFAEESITGSVNIPYTALKSGKVKLPQSKGKKLIFYCKGPK